MRLDLELDRVGEWVRRGGYRRVLIQSPLGLRHAALRVAEALEQMNVEAIISGGSCWGGCDVAYREAEAMGADAIIHIGHPRFLGRDKHPTYYLECRYLDPEPLLKVAEKAAEIMDGGGVVGVGATAQWLNHLSRVIRLLRERGVEAVAGGVGGVIRHEGQVLGCAYNGLLELEGRVSSYLVLGSIFHGLGLALLTRKPVYGADPFTQRVEELGAHAERVLAQRYAMIEGFRRAERIGVVVSLKPGQLRRGLASRLKGMVEEWGRKADIVVLDEVSEQALTDLPHQAFINTACQRLSIEDQQRLGKPLLLPSEALVAMGKLRWESVIRTPRYFSMEV